MCPFQSKEIEELFQSGLAGPAGPRRGLVAIPSERGCFWSTKALVHTLEKHGEGGNKYTNAQLPCLKRLINTLDKLRCKRWSHLHNATPPVSSPTFPQPAECFFSKSIWCYQPLLTPQPQVLEMFIAFPGSCSSLSPYPQAGPTLLEISHTLQSGLLAKQEAVAGSKTHRQPGGPLHVLNGQMATNCHLPVVLSIADFPCLALTVVDIHTLHVTNALTAASRLSEGPPAGFSL